MEMGAYSGHYGRMYMYSYNYTCTSISCLLSPSLPPSRQNILQFVTKYGEVVSFRYRFKAGTDSLEPRGYCFVESSSRAVCVCVC